MAENETVLETTEIQPETDVVKDIETVETQPESEQPSKPNKFLGAIKERLRKFVVKLKRRPMNIAFFMLIVSSLVFLFLLGNFSQAGLEYARPGVPIGLFVNTLFSILVLLLFLYAFPKRSKKPKIVMLVLCFVFMAVIIGLDILLYVSWSSAWVAHKPDLDEVGILAREKYIYTAINGAIAHAVLVAVAAVLTATYPLYGKLISKINTRKVIESTEIKEEIDTSEEV